MILRGPLRTFPGLRLYQRLKLRDGLHELLWRLEAMSSRGQVPMPDKWGSKATSWVESHEIGDWVFDIWANRPSAVAKPGTWTSKGEFLSARAKSATGKG